MAKVEQKTLGGAVIGTFVPTKTFDAEVHGRVNTYVEGETYWLRDGNAELLDQVKKWSKEGKVGYSLSGNPGGLG